MSDDEEDGSAQRRKVVKRSDDEEDGSAQRKKVVKRCCVESCCSTSLNEPNKRFLAVPNNQERRLAWLNAIGKDPQTVSIRARLYVCENHFNFEQDVINYIKHQLYPGSRIFLKPGVVPHIFTLPNKKSSEEESSESGKSTDSTLSAAPVLSGSSSETLSADESKQENISEPLDPQDVEDDDRSDAVLKCSVEIGGPTSPGNEIEMKSSSSTLQTFEAAEALCFMSASASTETPNLVPFKCDRETQIHRVQRKHKFATVKPYSRSKFSQCAIITHKKTQDAQTSPCVNNQKGS